MYSHQYDQHRAAKLQDGTEEMIRMRRPRAPAPSPRTEEQARGIKRASSSSVSPVREEGKCFRDDAKDLDERGKAAT